MHNQEEILCTQVHAGAVLLKADEGLSDEAVVRALNVGIATVGRVRQRFVEEGLESALNDKPRAPRKRKLTGKQEAHMIAVACSQPPKAVPAGHYACWPTKWWSWGMRNR
ncbi:MAG: helix-turn-helix domain-containing protein [Gammaproteobacteria bacterium]